MSSVMGSDQVDFFEMLFNFLKSVQSVFMPSSLSTTTIGQLQDDLDGCIIFAYCHVYNWMFSKRGSVWSQF